MYVYQIVKLYKEMTLKSYKNKFQFLIDDEDFEKVSKYNWWSKVYKRSTKPYLHSWINKKEITLHNFLLNPPKGFIVDHINGDTLDNRKSNLRICTVSENNRNIPKKTNKEYTSIYKDVSKIKSNNKWMSGIKYNGKSYYLGTYELEVDAAKAYDKKAMELFGEFANINFKESTG